MSNAFETRKILSILRFYNARYEGGLFSERCNVLLACRNDLEFLLISFDNTLDVTRYVLLDGQSTEVCSLCEVNGYIRTLDALEDGVALLVGIIPDSGIFRRGNVLDLHILSHVVIELVIPPSFRVLCTQPESTTFLPASPRRSSPQVFVL